MNNKKTTIGIDLGTTNSCFAFLAEGGKPCVIDTREGRNVMPSCVAKDVSAKDEKVWRIGDSARRQSEINSANTIYAAKRIIGKMYKELSEEQKKSFSTEIVEGKDGIIQFKFTDGTKLTPEEVASKILREIADTASEYLHQKVTDVVITVPAYFNNSQREATKNAAAIAGLNVLRIINEPTAAALAFGRDKNKDTTIAVYDLGGGTFDVSILKVSSDGLFEVLSTSGNSYLGGEDFDKKIIDHLINKMNAKSSVKYSDLSAKDQKIAYQRLKDAAEKAKIELSGVQSTQIDLTFLFERSHLSETLSRADLERLVTELVEKTGGPCEDALREASLKANQIDEILLVGGMTRMPLVKKYVEKIFGKAPLASINPDEGVAMGAAIQGGILMGDVKDILLLDVTPLNLGLETEGGLVAVMIDRNTSIPTKNSKIFTTAADNQSSVSIKIVQGDRPMAKDNKELGTFNLSGIPLAARGIPQIEVTLEIDVNGILSVKAKELKTGVNAFIEVSNPQGLSKEQIESMRAEAEAYKAEDEAKAKKIESRNKLLSLIFSAEKTLEGTKELEEKNPSVKTNVEAVKSHTKAAQAVVDKIDSTEEEIETAHNDLNKSLLDLGQLVYSSNNTQGPTPNQES